MFTLRNDKCCSTGPGSWSRRALLARLVAISAGWTCRGALAVQDAKPRAAEAEGEAAAASSSAGSSSSGVHDALPAPPAVLIHCVAGISRSPSVTIAYLMTRRAHSLRAAALLVKRARKVAYPNVGFLTALREMERYAHGGVESIPELAYALHKSCPLTALRIR